MDDSKHTTSDIEAQVANLAISDGTAGADVASPAAAMTVANTKLVIMPQGIPGLGKNTCCEAAIRMLGPQAIGIDQDQFNGNKKRCLQKFIEHLNNPQLKYIFVMRNNSVPPEYRGFISLSHKHRWKVLMLTPSEFSIRRDDFSEPLLEICCESVKADRGDHPFSKLTEAKRISIVRRFYKKFRPGSIVSTLADFVGILDWLTDDGTRRSIDAIATDIMQSIKTYEMDEPHPIFTSIHVPDEEKELLLGFTRTHVPDFDLGNKKEFIHHVTLMFSGDQSKSIESARFWYEKCLLRGKSIKVQVTGLCPITSSNEDPTINCIIFTVNLIDPDTDECVNHLVWSGAPHITGILPNGMPPAKSLELLKRDHVPIPCDIEFTNIIC